jgi:hypothetical protein
LRRQSLCLVVALLAFSGTSACGGDNSQETDGGAIDATADAPLAMMDSAIDAPTVADAAVDATHDAATPMDAGTDVAAPTDARTDVATIPDAGVDVAPSDAAHDAPATTDAGTDAATDAGTEGAAPDANTPPPPVGLCDLDGDGYERADPARGCPDIDDKHPGMVDCDDEDTGAFPGNYGTAGVCTGTLGMIGCALRGYCRATAPNGTPQDVACDGQPRHFCPSAACDADGDGFPNGAAGCNPSGAPIDCKDNDPTIFPGAPDRCGDGIAQDCTADTPCSFDADGDGYNKGVDCNDTNPAVFPFAVETCNGADDDCDGITDEGNPDATGQPLVAAGAVLHCTDSNVGSCATPPGDCVCSTRSLAAFSFDQSNRTVCPGETAAIDVGASAAPRCYLAGQPPDGGVCQ